jgi:acyl-CoA synthetase (AMP-forming)/AMP-acid ligase II
VGRGDRVAWLGPNHPAFLEALFASGLVGAMLAPGEPPAGGRRDPRGP